MERLAKCISLEAPQWLERFDGDRWVVMGVATNGADAQRWLEPTSWDAPT